MNDAQRSRIPKGLAVYVPAIAICFLIPFAIGALAGLATPGGWSPAQVGGLISAIAGGILTLVCTGLLIAYVVDG